MPEKKSNGKETKKRKRPLTWILFSLFLLFMAAVIVFGLTNLLVIFGGSHIKDDFEGKTYDCILVLGAGLYPDGTPSEMLADRLDVAIGLYEKGVSNVILLSGDRSDERNYDEVGAMEKYCLDRGVPAEAIETDGEGFSTYDSINNVKRNGKYKNIVIVTQKYHLYRAVFIAEKLGFSADGADAALKKYSGQSARGFREFGARTKDFFKVFFK